jgi:hypothetical protein
MTGRTMADGRSPMADGQWPMVDGGGVVGIIGVV